MKKYLSVILGVVLAVCLPVVVLTSIRKMIIIKM